MPNDEKYVFVFIRTDLSKEQQGIQAGHAVYGIANVAVHDSGTPNLVYIGVRDVGALKKVQEKLVKNQVAHFPWTEPDFDFGLTAIATVPLSVEEKELLRNYQTWKL